MDWTTYFGDTLVDLISDAELGILMSHAREAGANVCVDLIHHVVVIG